MKKLRVVYFGSPDFAVPALEALVRDAIVVACVTQTDKPGGRGQKLLAPAVKVAAGKHGIVVLQPKTLRDAVIQTQLQALDADLFVVAAYGKILPKEVLDTPPLGCVNLHASLLPKYRGAAPIAHALLAGEPKTGVCLMRMEEGLDTGPVYARAETLIGPEDDAGTLTDRLARIGAELLSAHLPALASGGLVAQTQPAGETYAGKIKKEDGRIDWHKPAQTVWNHVRAFSPWPSAFTFLAEPRPVLVGSHRDRSEDNLETKTLPPKRVQILRARPAGTTRELPGTVYRDGEHLLTACGDAALEVLELKIEGKRAMTAAEFLMGRPELPRVFTATSG